MDVQVTKDSKKDASDEKDKEAKPHHPEDTAKDGANEKLVPEIQTLLEFVAWLVWQKQIDTPRVQNGLMTKASTNWIKGRGGFLADELSNVQDASVRLQVKKKYVFTFTGNKQSYCFANLSEFIPVQMASPALLDPVVTDSAANLHNSSHKIIKLLHP